MKLLLVALLFFFFVIIESNVPSKSARRISPKEVVKFRCFLPVKKDKKFVHTQLVELPFSRFKSENNLFISFFKKICGKQCYTDKRMKSPRECSLVHSMFGTCKNIYKHNPYKCDCRALLYALKYKCPNKRYKKIFSKAFKVLTATLSKYKKKNHVTIPMKIKCQKLWFSKICLPKEFQPKTHPFRDVSTNFRRLSFFSSSNTLEEEEEQKELLSIEFE
eukprot:gene7683-12149_t